MAPVTRDLVSRERFQWEVLDSCQKAAGLHIFMNLISLETNTTHIFWKSKKLPAKISHESYELIPQQLDELTSS